jgi:hypothetical protein
MSWLSVRDRQTAAEEDADEARPNRFVHRNIMHSYVSCADPIRGFFSGHCQYQAAWRRSQEDAQEEII